MTIFKHEWKVNSRLFLIWTIVIAIMEFAVIAIFPEFKDQADSLNEMFATMGNFTTAFGMDRLSIGTALGYYGIEGGSIIGIGGGMLFALLGGSIICCEEGSRTAEFLFSAPVKRRSVLLWKALALFSFTVVFYSVTTITGIAAFGFIGETIEMKSFLLFQLAQFFLGLEIAGITFGISAFLRKQNFGIFLGLALALYFLSIISNLLDSLGWIKYITPYCYSDAAKILTDNNLETPLVILGLGYGLICSIAGILYYCRKDLRA